MATILEVDKLKVWYGKSQDNTIVNEISFKINLGETLGIQGKSGCGKSTIAWAVMGMMSYLKGGVEGSIVFNGENISGFSQRQYQKIRWKEIAIVPQAAMNSFHPMMKIKDSIKEVLKLHCKSMKKSEIKDRCEELMEIVDLDKKVLNYYPHEMSGGMKQRAAIATALACNPKLLILDEATTGLDVLTEAEVLRVVKELQQKNNMAILFISHDLRLVEALCHDKILINDGDIKDGNRLDLEESIAKAV